MRIRYNKRSRAYHPKKWDTSFVARVLTADQIADLKLKVSPYTPLRTHYELIDEAYRPIKTVQDGIKIHKRPFSSQRMKQKALSTQSFIRQTPSQFELRDSNTLIQKSQRRKRPNTAKIYKTSLSSVKTDSATTRPKSVNHGPLLNSTSSLFPRVVYAVQYFFQKLQIPNCEEQHIKQYINLQAGDEKRCQNYLTGYLKTLVQYSDLMDKINHQVNYREMLLNLIRCQLVEGVRQKDFEETVPYRLVKIRESTIQIFKMIRQWRNFIKGNHSFLWNNHKFVDIVKQDILSLLASSIFKRLHEDYLNDLIFFIPRDDLNIEQCDSFYKKILDELKCDDEWKQLAQDALDQFELEQIIQTQRSSLRFFNFDDFSEQNDTKSMLKSIENIIIK